MSIETTRGPIRLKIERGSVITFDPILVNMVEVFDFGRSFLGSNVRQHQIFVPYSEEWELVLMLKRKKIEADDK